MLTTATFGPQEWSIPGNAAAYGFPRGGPRPEIDRILEA
jgi:hypothetical protein